ncbi:MAG: DUF4960 domain-containing protein [Muribaculaceae bacterium]|nr:DUF4960 domain-containing protein [Muribaculaceae bacterium]
MKKSLLKTSVAAVALACAASASASTKAAILIGYPSVESIDNYQEYAAAEMFSQLHPDGTVIAAGETSKIDATKFDVIWVHIDRVGSGIGNLPSAFSDEATVSALAKFVENGGNLYLSKQATQLVHKLGRMDAKFAPGIYGDGEGGDGFDDWTIMAQIGWWFNQEGTDHYFPEQYYDHRDHAIYAGMTEAVCNDYLHESFPVLGTGDPATSLWREDHNCLWDLNVYTYNADGANTVEKFQNENNAVVLGTWGHVQDHAVAGIVEFLPSTRSNGGTIIANGLAAYELSPRSGVNAYTDNIRKLTANTINYLVKSGSTSIVSTAVADADAKPEYFTLQGVKMAEDQLVPGLYIKRQGDKASKVVVK